MRETVSLHIGNTYDVYTHGGGLFRWRSELVELNCTQEYLGGEVIVDQAGFANGQVIDLTDPTCVLKEAGY